jgi:hypothetical protein
MTVDVWSEGRVHFLVHSWSNIVPRGAILHASLLPTSGLGRAFGCEPKSLPLSPIFLGHKSQPARPTTTTVRPQSLTGLLRFYDSAG